MSDMGASGTSGPDGRAWPFFGVKRGHWAGWVNPCRDQQQGSSSTVHSRLLFAGVRFRIQILVIKEQRKKMMGAAIHLKVAHQTAVGLAASSPFFPGLAKLPTAMVDLGSRPERTGSEPDGEDPRIRTMFATRVEGDIAQISRRRTE